MKILGKDVFIGNKCVCTEFTSKILGDLNDKRVGEKSHEGKIVERDIMFVKDKSGYYVDIRDTEGLGAFALKFFGAAPRWITNPYKAGDEYIEIKPYFSKSAQEDKFTLEELLEIANISKDVIL